VAVANILELNELSTVCRLVRIVVNVFVNALVPFFSTMIMVKTCIMNQHLSYADDSDLGVLYLSEHVLTG